MTEKVAEFEEKDCKCGKKFRFYVGEKEYYAQNGLQEPKKCPKCREKDKIRKFITSEVERIVAEKLGK